METRELRYFVAVAEELHFGQAARRLGIAQPPLSRAIGQLERRLGVTLLERTSRSVTLTEAGAVLLREGRAALDAVEAADRRTRRAAAAAGDGGPGLVLATKAAAAGELLAKLLDAYAAEPGAVTVDVLLCGIAEQEGLLRDGRADVALLHLPFDSTAGFDTEVLSTEGQVLLVPAGHPVATRPHVTLAEAGALPGLAAARRQLPRGPRPRGARTRPGGPAGGARPGRGDPPGIRHGRPAPRSRRGAGAGRAPGDHGDRLAGAQPVAGPGRPDPRRDPPLTPRRGSDAAARLCRNRATGGAPRAGREEHDRRLR
jgi:DNA-binding transcriptional LysR family regulator